MALQPTKQALAIDCVPVAKKRKLNVVDEETFTTDMEAIIERDFYPDLPKLKECLEYQDALEKSDIGKLNELRMKWKDRTDDVRTNSPSGFETPFDANREPGDENEQRRNEEEEPNKDVGDPKSKLDKLTLDKYLAKYTSEDNSSFDSLMEEAKEKHKEKYPWLYLDENKESKKFLDNLRVPSIEEQSNNEASNKLLTWKYQNLNSIMYYPQNAKLTQEEMFDRTKRDKVVHENTRFKVNPFNERLNAATIAEAAYLHAKENKGKIGVDGKELLPSDVHVNGYKFVSMTPSPSPSAINSPLMTWGVIDGTPHRLDETPGHLSVTPGTPQFKIPETPAREKIALSLSDKLSKKKQENKIQALKRVENALRTPSPLIIGSPRTPSERLSSMSPAAQSLATSKLGIHRNSDAMLRESYSPSPQRSKPSTPLRHHIHPSIRETSTNKSDKSELRKAKAMDFF